MAIEKNIVIGADLSGLERKLEELIDLLKDSQKAADKTADSVENIAEEVGEVGDSAKDAKKGIDGLSKGFKGLGLSIKAAGIGLIIEGFQLFKDVLSSNQGVADTFATSLQTLIFAFNGIIKAVSSGNFASIPSVLGESLTKAREFVQLEKEVAIADAERAKTQLEFQMMAERGRQIRDDEMRTIEDRIEANELVNYYLQEQMKIEEELVDKKVALAQLEYDRNPNNENYLALLEAQTEQIDIQERIEGQMSEYMMNKNGLQRELNDLKQSEIEGMKENHRVFEQANVDRMNNELERVKRAKELSNEYFEIDKADLERRMELVQEGTQAYMDLQNEFGAVVSNWYAEQLGFEKELADIKRQNIQQNFDLTSQGFDALMQLNEAFAEDDEASAKRAFERNKKLQTAQAVVNTAQAVTAQLAVPQDALTGANFVKAGIALATGIAQIRTIQATQFEGGTGSLDTSVSEPQAPSFNIVGSTGANAILESLQNNPVRAYVVGSDVTSQQELDRNRINQVSFP
jgi:hypothetical protein